MDASYIGGYSWQKKVQVRLGVSEDTRCQILKMFILYVASLDEANPTKNFI